MKEFIAELEYPKYARTGKTETYADVFVYDDLMTCRRKWFLGICSPLGDRKILFALSSFASFYSNAKGRNEDIQRYKKGALTMKVWAKQFVIALELNLTGL